MRKVNATEGDHINKYEEGHKVSFCNESKHVHD